MGRKKKYLTEEARVEARGLTVNKYRNTERGKKNEKNWNLINQIKQTKAFKQATAPVEGLLNYFLNQNNEKTLKKALDCKLENILKHILKRELTETETKQVEILELKIKSKLEWTLKAEMEFYKAYSEFVDKFGACPFLRK